MGKIWIHGGGGGSDLDVITAAAGDVVSGKVIVGPDGEPLTGTLAFSGNAGAGDVLSGKTFYNTNPKSKTTGTMANRGAWNGSCGTNGSVTIPAGYHNGSGKVTNSQATMAGGTYTPSNAQQTVSCNGKLMTGNIVIKAKGTTHVCTVFTVSTSGSKSFYQQNNSRWVTYQYLQINTRMAGVLGFSAEQSGGMYGAHLCNDGSNVWCMTYGPNGANWMNTSNGAFAISASALVIPVPVSGTYKVRVYGYTN